MCTSRLACWVSACKRMCGKAPLKAWGCRVSTCALNRWFCTFFAHFIYAFLCTFYVCLFHSRTFNLSKLLCTFMYVHFFVHILFINISFMPVVMQFFVHVICVAHFSAHFLHKFFHAISLMHIYLCPFLGPRGLQNMKRIQSEGFISRRPLICLPGTEGTQRCFFIAFS